MLQVSVLPFNCQAIFLSPLADKGGIQAHRPAGRLVATLPRWSHQRAVLPSGPPRRCARAWPPGPRRQCSCAPVPTGRVPIDPKASPGSADAAAPRERHGSGLRADSGTTLGYAEHPWLASGGRLAWREAQPSSKIAPASEVPRIADRSRQGGCIDHPDPGNR